MLPGFQYSAKKSFNICHGTTAKSLRASEFKRQIISETIQMLSLLFSLLLSLLLLDYITILIVIVVDIQ